MKQLIKYKYWMDNEFRGNKSIKKKSILMKMKLIKILIMEIYLKKK